MGKARALKTFKFIIFLLLVCLIVFGFYYFFSHEKNPFSTIIDSFTEKEMLDNHNGVYHYKEELGSSYMVYNGCTINYISNYILVNGDKYYTYRTSCLGTYPKKSGDVKELDFRIDEETKKYYIKYDKVDYVKDEQVYSIEPTKEPIDNIATMNLESFGLLMEETQIPGYYYDFKYKANNLSLPFFVAITPNEKEDYFTLVLYNARDEILFQYIIEDFEYMPQMYPYGKQVVFISKAIEKKDDKVLQRDNFMVIGNKGLIYNLATKFPIVVDDVELTAQNSIFVKFDKKSQVFRMLIGYDNKFCDENGTSNDVIAYEFSIDYNYLSDSFEDPEFVKKIYAKDKCTYVNNLMER